MSELTIDLKAAGVRFEGKKNSSESIKSWLASKLSRSVLENRNYVVDALRDINLTIKSGERVGLIGLNGAGKSTLLKVMARIYPVTSGKALIKGHVCPMFE